MPPPRACQKGSFAGPRLSKPVQYLGLVLYVLGQATITVPLLFWHVLRLFIGSRRWAACTHRDLGVAGCSVGL
jgi:hypothetical protein